MPAGTCDVVDYFDEDAVERFLRLVRDTSPLYDLFIVSYHGDREYVGEPSPLKTDVLPSAAGGRGAHRLQPPSPCRAGIRGEPGERSGAAHHVFDGELHLRDDMEGGPADPDDPLDATGEAYMLSVSVRCTDMGCAVLQRRTDSDRQLHERARGDGGGAHDATSLRGRPRRRVVALLLLRASGCAWSVLAWLDSRPRRGSARFPRIRAPFGAPTHRLRAMRVCSVIVSSQADELVLDRLELRLGRGERPGADVLPRVLHHFPCLLGELSPAA